LAINGHSAETAVEKTDFTSETVLSTLDDPGVRTIALNRPDRLNAMNRRVLEDVARAFDDANADEASRAVIFKDEGRAFCAGDDRHDHTHPENEAEARDLVNAIQDPTRAMVFGAKPIVGVMNGWAVGGGFE
jgi:enoyl-CoA hydratase/carnithine racemase